MSNLADYVLKVLTDDDCKDLTDLYNGSTGSNIHVGMLPFVSLDTIKSLLKSRIQWLQQTFGSNGRALNGSGIDYIADAEIKKLEQLLAKLDEDAYWVGVATIEAGYIKEYNTVTECHPVNNTTRSLVRHKREI